MSETEGWNGYVDWASELSGLNRGGTPSGRASKNGVEIDDGDRGDLANYWEPVFVRSTRPEVSTRDFFGRLDGNDPQTALIRYDILEREYNHLARRAGHPVEAILYRRLDARAHDFGADAAYPDFEILAVGGMVEPNGVPATVARRGADVLGPEVAIGVIDDGIGVLNGRFRSGKSTTRVRSMLSQIPARVEPKSLVTGRVVPSTLIEDELRRPDHRPESEFYAHLAADIYRKGTRHSLAGPATHGTHILDLAAGTAPGSTDPLGQVPILAVQLSPQAFDDTSGARLILDIVQALRWLILTADGIGMSRSSDRPATQLIVNMSLGYVAGPKDGTSFVEQQIAREIERAREAFGIEVTLVVPYGNAYNDRLVARRQIEPGDSYDVLLRLQPDDRTPSFAEVRLPPGSAGQHLDNIEIGLVSARGHVGLAPTKIAAGCHADVTDATGRLVARVYHTPARGPVWEAVEPGYLTIAFAPTRATFSDHDRTCPSGGWTIEVRNCGGDTMDLTLQVQRDDNPFPRQVGARQARLDAPGAHLWNRWSRAFDGLDGTGITHAGTNSALSSIASANVVSVGAALVRVDPDDDRKLRVEPARSYAAEAADPCRSPDLSAVSETGFARAGVRASGLFSGATTRISGSSTATATATRQLALKALARTSRSVQVLPEQATTDDALRLGSKTILDNPEIRRR